MTDQDINIEEWLDEEVPEDAVTMMLETSVVSFGTALWSS
ncbi:Uncharacterised protein [BD1-7 clade bacterium]|uniref:Uncharacterized protein n=1 Tax=BD1-7 clade bacterium TaxID=2029982 RepID=A0A5S9PQ63_9GAMM|nr:Uncharacterised protein [BD1-7 clade bacterium]